jgi:hypothetical protein
MAMPASTFSLVAASTQPFGATMRTPRDTSSGVTTACMPPKWSMWLWVTITARIGAWPRCLRASASAAAAVSREVRGSTRIQPLCPTRIDRLARS